MFKLVWLDEQNTSIVTFKTDAGIRLVGWKQQYFAGFFFLFCWS